MLGQLILVVGFLTVGARTWSQVRNPFEMPPVPKTTVQPITNCMHVASEEGNYSFKKSQALPLGRDSISLAADVAVCGLYVVAPPDKLVEITVKYMHVSCDSGGLLAFVDGWELNGQYFPSESDHELPIEQRVSEFCTAENEFRLRDTFAPFAETIKQRAAATRAGRQPFRSHQNAALLQYRIPVRGAFIVNVRFLENTKPCHILTEGLAPFYTLRNYGARGNCTLTALYPAVVELKALSVGAPLASGLIDFDCNGHADRLEIGGSAGLDSSAQPRATAVCGATPKRQPPNKEIAPNEQAIFCEVTTVRLVSGGAFANEAKVSVRPAGEADVAVATLLCDA